MEQARGGGSNDEQGIIAGMKADAALGLTSAPESQTSRANMLVGRNGADNSFPNKWLKANQGWKMGFVEHHLPD
jgi:hypothetical protein